MSQVKLFLEDIAKTVAGSLRGDGKLIISRIRPLDIAGPGDLSFYAPSSGKKAQELYELARGSKATALLVLEHDDAIPCAQIAVANPMGAVIHLAVRYFDTTPKPAPGAHPTAIVAESAEIGTNVAIGAYAVIGERVRIGENSIIHPHVVIYDDAAVGRDCVIHSGAVIRERTSLGNDCLIQNGAVLGSDGFGYIPDPKLGQRRIPHLGSLSLSDRVDVGSNSAIDRATLGESVLGEATKVDNLVQVGHNVVIGKRVILCGQVGIAGSCNIGDDVIFGGNVGLADHTTIGTKVRASAKSGITNSVPESTDVSGYPHQPGSEWRRQNAAVRRLPGLFAEVRALKKALKELQDQQSGGSKSKDSPQ